MMLSFDEIQQRVSQWMGKKRFRHTLGVVESATQLAKLYNVETKRINEAVKDNIEKFPERYCFKLTDDESNNLLVEIFDQKINTN